MGSSNKVLAKTLLCPSWNIAALRACCVLPVATTLDSGGRVVRSWSKVGLSCSVASLVITTVSSIFICQSSSAPSYRQQPTFVNLLAQTTLVLFIMSTIVSTLAFIIKKESWIRLVEHLLIADAFLSKWDHVPNHSSQTAIFRISTFLLNTMCFLLGFYQVELNITFSPGVCVNAMWGRMINDATHTLLLITLESIAKRFQRLNTVIRNYHPPVNFDVVWPESNKWSYNQLHILPARKRKQLQRTTVRDFSKTYESILEASVTLNSYFSVLTPVSVLIAFMLKVVMIFILVSYAIGNEESIPVSFAISIIVPGTIGIIELTHFLHYCRWSCEEASRTSIYVHKLCNESYDDGLKTELVLFSKQLLRREFKYSACGLFVLDYSLLYSFVCATSTYVVILMQFIL